MLKTINTDRLDYIENIDDVILFNDLYLIRTSKKLTAISIKNYDVIWEIIIEGETRINLNKIFLVNDIIIVFSYSREKDLYCIKGINETGKVIWSSSSKYRPNGKHGVCIKNSKLIFNGYSNKFSNTLIIEVDPKDGTINTLVDLKTSASYLCNVNDNLILSGSTGIYLLNGNKTLKLISDEFLESIIDSNEKKMTYVSQTEEKGVFSLSVLDENLRTIIIGKINLDSSDRDNMFPFLNGNKVISFKGECDGILYTDLTEDSEIWHIGSGKLKGISVEILDDKNIAILHRDLDYNTSLYVYDLNTGKLNQKTDFEGIPGKIHNFNGTLIIGSSLGMYICEWQKN